MGTITVIYRRSRTPGSLLIRLGSWFAPWSHVGILSACGTYVIEASATKGVVRASLGEFLAASSKYEFIDIECPAPVLGLRFAEEQVGKPYDWGAVFGIVAREYSWAHEDKWYCSELLEAVLAAAGRLRVRRDVHKINVDQSYIIR